YVLDPTVTEIQFSYYYIPRPVNRRGSDTGTDDDSLEGEWLDAWGPDHMEITEVIAEEESEEGEAPDRSTQLMEREITMRLPLAVEVLITSENQNTGDRMEWQPLIIPLMESRVLGVSVKRRDR
ncbi:MAG TPA: hypothetical protein PLV45_14240, partial [bacterium]|nr:hypothetical protein [bacterium]